MRKSIFSVMTMRRITMGNKHQNCVNCGAVIDAEVNKCPYCNTSYLDICGFDFEDHTPFVLKFKYKAWDGKEYIISTSVIASQMFEINCNPGATEDVTIDLHFVAVPKQNQPIISLEIQKA